MRNYLTQHKPVNLKYKDKTQILPWHSIQDISTIEDSGIPQIKLNNIGMSILSSDTLNMALVDSCMYIINLVDITGSSYDEAITRGYNIQLVARYDSRYGLTIKDDNIHIQLLLKSSTNLEIYTHHIQKSIVLKSIYKYSIPTSTKINYNTTGLAINNKPPLLRPGISIRESERDFLPLISNASNSYEKFYYFNNLYILFTYDTIYYSADGIEWTCKNLTYRNGKTFLYNNKLYMIYENTTFYTSDGINWINTTNNLPNNFINIIQLNDTFVTWSSNTGLVYYSSDLISWSTSNIPYHTSNNEQFYNSSQFKKSMGGIIAQSNYGNYYFSFNGKNWYYLNWDYIYDNYIYNTINNINSAGYSGLGIKDNKFYFTISYTTFTNKTRNYIVGYTTTGKDFTQVTSNYPTIKQTLSLLIEADNKAILEIKTEEETKIYKSIDYINWTLITTFTGDINYVEMEYINGIIKFDIVYNSAPMSEHSNNTHKLYILDTSDTIQSISGYYQYCNVSYTGNTIYIHQLYYPDKNTGIASDKSLYISSSSRGNLTLPKGCQYFSAAPPSIGTNVDIICYATYSRGSNSIEYPTYIKINNSYKPIISNKGKVKNIITTNPIYNDIIMLIDNYSSKINKVSFNSYNKYSTQKNYITGYPINLSDNSIFNNKNINDLIYFNGFTFIATDKGLYFTTSLFFNSSTTYTEFSELQNKIITKLQIVNRNLFVICANDLYRIKESSTYISGIGEKPDIERVDTQNLLVNKNIIKLIGTCGKSSDSDIIFALTDSTTNETLYSILPDINTGNLRLYSMEYDEFPQVGPWAISHGRINDIDILGYDAIYDKITLILANKVGLNIFIWKRDGNNYSFDCLTTIESSEEVYNVYSNSNIIYFSEQSKVLKLECFNIDPTTLNNASILLYGDKIKTKQINNIVLFYNTNNIKYIKLDSIIATTNYPITLLKNFPVSEIKYMPNNNIILIYSKYNSIIYNFSKEGLL